MHRSGTADLPLHGGRVPAWLAQRMAELGTAISHTEKVEGFRRLDRLTREVEQHRQPLADFDAVLEHEHAISPSLNGRSVTQSRPRKTDPQLSLFSR